MNLYCVRYPFEIDREEGLSDRLYPSLRAARQEARSEIDAHLADEHHYLILRSAGPDRLVRAEIERVEVVPLTAANLCDILNSRGGQYVAHAEVVAVVRVAVPDHITDDSATDFANSGR